MILLTGAGGRTGKALLRALVAKDAQVRAFIRNPEQADGLRALGAADVAVGNMEDVDSINRAAGGTDVIIHVGPPMHPQEREITKSFVEATKNSGASRFIYYSVMYPILRDVRHHSLKLDATEMIVNSGITYSIIEPCRYMQHLDPIWPAVLETGVHSMPFNTKAQFAVVDLEDLAQATAKVATEAGHEFATYELAGPQNLSQEDMAAAISEVLGRPVRAEALPLDVMAARAIEKGASEDRVNQMRIMNTHYDHSGFRGNPNVLQWLLGRPATAYIDFVRRLAAG
ncbi:unannotated protein [freshwater metagenome]|jgi:hypothetical protein|uniref:Unannotated protein n=1 Tax=freshwater metagenome TaxID=449393 RepID=A0A6J7E1J2_9ZZZZ|nr:NAD(P)H-binding protein [Actinomycetota bacterium]